MLKYGMSNIRRLETLEPFEIKPITLLVGRNSGGKSTFLRTFPLFRQSLMTRTSSPILWYGDLVDFGSFDSAVSRSCDPKEISFSFNFDSLQVDEGPYFFSHSKNFYGGKDKYTIGEISYEVCVVKKGESNIISRITIKMKNPDSLILIEVADGNVISKLTVDGYDVMRGLSPVKLLVGAGSLFPEVRFVMPREYQSREIWFSLNHATVLPRLSKLLRRVIDKRIKDSTIEGMGVRLISLGFPSVERVSALSRNFPRTAAAVFDEILSNKESSDYRELLSLLSLAAMPSLSRAISSYLSAIFKSTLYIGPARARSERYYRYQDLSVSEIDPDGKNFPMFLNSLTDRQRKGFSDWVKRLFGYGVNISQQTGHISIILVDGDVKTNIVDVGYGVSQILPVLGQIWWARERPSHREVKSPFSLLAIEQPELHLHPAHQALLADALIEEMGSSASQSRRMNYLVETHSETLINRLGEFISAGKLEAKDVQVVLFEPNEDDGNTRVRAVQFSEDGALVDWPYGFFQPRVM